MREIDLKFYRENGFLILKNFFDKAAVRSILRDAKEIFLRQIIRKGYTAKQDLLDINDDEFNIGLYRLFQEDFITLTNCGKQAQHLFSLHRLSLGEEIIKLLKETGLSTPIISTRPVLYFNHPKLAKQKVFYKVDAHQDWRSMQGSLNSVVIWAPLVDINKDLGALEVLAGSHLQGLRTDHLDNGFGMVNLQENERAKLVSVELEVGDALLFSSFLIHQSGENITNRPRWSCHFRYNDLDDPTFIDRGFAHPYIYRPQEELITRNFPSKEEVVSIFK